MQVPSKAVCFLLLVPGAIELDWVGKVKLHFYTGLLYIPFFENISGTRKGTLNFRTRSACLPLFRDYTQKDSLF